MVCLSHSSYGMQGLVSLMNVLFWERRDFHVRFSGRDMSGNVWNRPSGSSIVVDMGILIFGSHHTWWSPLSLMLLDLMGHDHTYIQGHPPSIRHLIKSYLCYRTGPYYRFDIITFFWKVSIGAAIWQRTLTPENTWSCPIWYLHLFLFWDHSFLNLSCLWTFLVEKNPRYFFFA